MAQTKQITFQLGKLVHAELTIAATGTFYKIDRKAYSNMANTKIYPYNEDTELLLKKKLNVIRITIDFIYAKLG